jgi:uncharacterized damage-inducible protein DinB
MHDALLDAFRHSAWANRQLIEFCRKLTLKELGTKGPVAYGSILETLQHMVGSESFYRFMFTGSFSDWDWHDDVLPTLDQLAAWSSELAAFWEQLLQSPVDADARLVQTTPNGVRHEDITGILLAHIIHHAAIHREQINGVLTHLGIEPPELDPRDYAHATGRPPASTAQDQSPLPRGEG